MVRVFAENAILRLNGRTESYCWRRDSRKICTSKWLKFQYCVCDAVDADADAVAAPTADVQRFYCHTRTFSVRKCLG